MTPPVEAADRHVVAFEAIGTRWSVTTGSPLDTALLGAVHRTIDDYDRVFSRFRPDSTVMAAARAPGIFPLPAETAAPLLALYDRLAALTEGAVSPLVGASLEHLGYDAGYGLRPLPGYLPAPRWDEVCDWDGERLTTRAPVVIDVGAVGKGQLVDLVAGVLERAGVTRFTVDAGGDLRHRGAAPALRVGLEHPGRADGRTVVGVVEVEDGAVCGSAPNRRTWGDGVHHVLDARTGAPTRGVAATWGVARSAMLADAAATALFFVPPERLGALDAGASSPTGGVVPPGAGVTGVVLGDDGRARWSSGLPGAMFSEAS